MTMRFILGCMVIVGLCLLALPLVPVYNGIQDERRQILAEADSNVNVAVPPPIEQNEPETEFASDIDPAALADIEPAAGVVVTTPDTFTGGFNGEAPAALDAE